jgi:ABC-type polysaccharide/polyol phosphate export permease
MWHGDYLYLIQNLVVKDFKIRYRNMSLGVLWSLLNPLVMMAVYYFVFTKIFPNSIPNFPLFLLCGIVPFNFFTVAWATGTTSIVDNAGLIKRVPVPREVIPITTVLSCCIHLLVQIALLLVVAIVSGKGINRYWLWLPVVWGLEIIFVCGLALFSAALNVFVRDTRYVVESATWVLLFLVPVFYDSNLMPEQYRSLIYETNPVAATVIALRKIVYGGQPPVATTLWKMLGAALTVFLVGILVFRRMKPMFYEHI